MRDPTDRERKIIKAALLLSVIISAALGLKGVFIDLYDPGSPVARQYSDWVNVIFVVTVLISLPLLIEKYNKYTRWYKELSSTDNPDEWRAMLWKVAKPIAIQIITVITLVVLVSVIIAWYWQIPPEVVTTYKNYYSPKSACCSIVDITKDINITAVNNITTVNLTKP